jgi:hypothetical protein
LIRGRTSLLTDEADRDSEGHCVPQLEINDGPPPISGRWLIDTFEFELGDEVLARLSASGANAQIVVGDNQILVGIPSDYVEAFLAAQDSGARLGLRQCAEATSTTPPAGA